MLWLRLCLTGLLGLASPLLAQAKGDAVLDLTKRAQAQGGR